MTAGRDYEDELAPIRALRRRLIIGYAIPPVTLALCLLPVYLLPEQYLIKAWWFLFPLASLAVFVAMVAMLLVLAYYLQQLHNCRCPRCGELFWRAGFWALPRWREGCQNCGLSLSGRNP